ncbi:MAG: hypothetical protein GY807_18075 [Gammaproteobacteria bacterium]|nr:hypothetical protein [Gammaproteobacteria bacterium]
MIVTLRLLILTFCLLSSQRAVADSNSGRHWSEGVYFPPQTQPDRAQRPSYTRPEQPAYVGADKKRYNPWALPAEGNGAQRVPGYESLGYPGEGYDPYRSADQVRQPPSGQVDSYAPRYGDYPATDYYPDQDRYDKRFPSSGSHYPSTGHGRGYQPEPNSPTYDVDGHYPPLYDFGAQRGGGLNSFFLYGAGLPYLPSWW